MLLGSAGAFLLFVAPLSILTVVSILLGLMLMFGLGFQAGAHEMTPHESAPGVMFYNPGILLQVRREWIQKVGNL